MRGDRPEQLHVHRRRRGVGPLLVARDEQADHLPIADDRVNEDCLPEAGMLRVNRVDGRLEDDRRISPRLGEESERRRAERVDRLGRAPRHDQSSGELVEPIGVFCELGADPGVGQRGEQLLAGDGDEPLRPLHHLHALDDDVEQVHLLVRLGELLAHALHGRAVGAELNLVVVDGAGQRGQPPDFRGRRGRKLRQAPLAE